ncbi:MAG: GNAT family N-acetyltransferase [Pseudomonadota bacterium]
MNIEVEPLTGPAFQSAIDDLAQLRIRIFRDWPYLYDGDLAYEEKYLSRFVEAPRAFLAVAKYKGRIVGAATATPLSVETDEFKEPFLTAGYDLGKIFYFAESLLLPEYRGKGIGHRFFDLREAHAGSFGEYEHSVFCGVIRPENHAARPLDYRPLDGFWKKRGYSRLDGIVTSFPWKDVGETIETEKQMQFWIRSL